MGIGDLRPGLFVGQTRGGVDGDLQQGLTCGDLLAETYMQLGNLPAVRHADVDYALGVGDDLTVDNEVITNRLAVHMASLDQHAWRVSTGRVGVCIGPVKDR